MFDNVPGQAQFLPFSQSLPYAVAAAVCGARMFTADLGPGTAQVVQRGRVRLILRGPLWQGGTADEQRAALRRFARWPGVTVVTPEAPLQGFGLIPLVTPMHHAVWDLSGDLRAGLARNWRGPLAVAERAGVQAARGGVLEALIVAEAAQRAQRRYQALPPAFTRALPDAALRLWHWHAAGRMQAAMAFVVHGSTASYHLAWASAAARDSGAHRVMLMQAAEALRAEGVRWLDLGSVNTEDALGLARFKLGTGASLRRLGATLLVLPG